MTTGGLLPAYSELDDKEPLHFEMNTLRDKHIKEIKRCWEEWGEVLTTTKEK